MKKHADHQRKAAAQELQELQELEQEATEKDGIPALQQTYAQAQKHLDEIDKQIGQAEDRIMAMMQQKANYASGDDAEFKQAVETISASLKQENMDDLYRYARLTITAKDDLLVNELPMAEQRRGQIQQTLREYKRNHDKHLSRLAELEQVRRKFKSQRYDDIRSGFGNGSLLTLALGQFLQGLASSGNLWDSISREQRYRPRSSRFPTSNRGRSRRTSTRNFPFPGGGGSWGGGGLGGGGLGGGGGFRTGGGF